LKKQIENGFKKKDLNYSKDIDEEILNKLLLIQIMKIILYMIIFLCYLLKITKSILISKYYMKN
jgi:hypothetical protein